MGSRSPEATRTTRCGCGMCRHARPYAPWQSPEGWTKARACPAVRYHLKGLQESLKTWAIQKYSKEGLEASGLAEEKPRSDAVLMTARGTKSGTSGLGDCWDSADVIPSPRCSGPQIPPTLQSPHVSQDFLSLDHLLSRVPPTLRRSVTECNKKDEGWIDRFETSVNEAQTLATVE
jgi:hypothetical protein